MSDLKVVRVATKAHCVLCNCKSHEVAYLKVGCMVRIVCGSCVGRIENAGA